MYLSSTPSEAPTSNNLLLDINIQCSRNNVMCSRVSDAKYSLIADVHNLTTDYFHLASNFHAFIFVIMKCVNVEMRPLPFPFHNFLCLPAVELVRLVWPAVFVAKHRKILRDLCSACPELVLWSVHYCWPCVEHSCAKKTKRKDREKTHELLFFRKLTHSCFKMKNQRKKAHEFSGKFQRTKLIFQIVRIAHLKSEELLPLFRTKPPTHFFQREKKNEM